MNFRDKNLLWALAAVITAILVCVLVSAAALKMDRRSAESGGRIDWFLYKDNSGREKRGVLDAR